MRRTWARKKKFYDGLKVDGSGLQIWLVGHHEFSLFAHSFARLFVSKEASCGAVQAAERYVCLCRASPFHWIQTRFSFPFLSHSTPQNIFLSFFIRPYYNHRAIANNKNQAPMTKHRLTHIFNSIKATPNIVPTLLRLDQLDTFHKRLIYVFKSHIFSKTSKIMQAQSWSPFHSFYLFLQFLLRLQS